MAKWSIHCAGDFCNQRSPVVSPISKNIVQLFSTSQIRILNLEAPITSFDKPMKKSGPSLRIDPGKAKLLTTELVNVVALANNHFSDYGIEGIRDTIKYLQGQNIAFTGAHYEEASAYKPALMKPTEDVIVAIFSVCEREFGIAEKGSGGVAWYGHPLFWENLKIAKQNGQLIVVQFHGGVELLSIPTPRIIELFHNLIKNYNVSLIVGHHPHVPQGFENVNNGLIFYSLGDFYWPLSAGQLDFKRSISFTTQIDFNNDLIEDYKIYPIHLDKELCLNLLNRNYIDNFNRYLKFISSPLNNDSEYKNVWSYAAKEVFDERYAKELFGIGNCNHNVRNVIKYFIMPMLYSLKHLFGYSTKTFENKALHLFNIIQNESHREIILEGINGNRINKKHSVIGNKLYNEILKDNNK